MASSNKSVKGITANLWTFSNTFLPIFKAKMIPLTGKSFHEIAFELRNDLYGGFKGLFMG